MQAVPTLTTPRLELVPVHVRHWPLYRRLLRDPEVTRYLPKQAPYSDEEIMQTLHRRIDHWQQHGFGTFTILLRQQPIGYVGIERVGNHGDVDIRYALHPDYLRQGFTKEAAHTCLNWYFRQGDQPCVFGVVIGDNQASIATLKSLAMRPHRPMDFYPHPGLCYFVVHQSEVVDAASAI